MAFTIKIASKFAGRDYGVCKLEGLWWVDSGELFMTQPKETWSWRLLIRTPDFIGKRELEAARKQLAARGKHPRFHDVELITLSEKQCVQVLHKGYYDSEPETVARMEAFAAQRGYRFDGLHHEIYLSDPRRVAPDKLRTILRIPVRAAQSLTLCLRAETEYYSPGECAGANPLPAPGDRRIRRDRNCTHPPAAHSCS